MPTKTLTCSNCGKQYGVQEDAYTNFTCLVCGSAIQHNVTRPTGTSTVRTPVTSPTNWPQNSAQSLRTNSNRARGIWSEIGAGALVIGAIIVIITMIVMPIYNHFKPNEQNQVVTASPPTHIPQPAPQSQPPQAVVPANQSEAINTAVTPEYELCTVRIVNTLHGTDKTGGYKAVMDEQAKTLTLSYINNASEYITLTYEGGGLCTLRFYDANQLQAEKTMYRRTDLETGSKEMVYTSRTEEIQVTIKYN